VSEKQTINRISPHASLALPDRFFDLPGAKKIDALLNVENPKELIQSLGSEELYFLIHEIGLPDCTDIISLSSSKQRKAFIDLDCWMGDSFDIADFHRWLDIIKASSIHSVTETIGALDPELLVNYVLMNTHMIFDRSEEDDIQTYQSHGEIIYSPDREYALGIPAQTRDSVERLAFVIDQMYRHDQARARNVLRTAKADLRIEAEEMAWRFRTKRLCDLGFPEPEDAHVLYAPIRVQELLASLEKEKPPHSTDPAIPLGWSLARARNAGPFLDRCYHNLNDNTRFLQQFVLCVNRAIVASPEGIALRNLDRVNSITQSVHATISLGLEHLAKGNLATGEAILDRVELVNLFQVGHGLIRLLADRAQKLRLRGGELFDEETTQLVAALCCRPQPRLGMSQGQWIPFRTCAEVAEVSKALSRTENLCDVFENSFGFTLERFQEHGFKNIPESQRPMIEFKTLGRTLVAHIALDHSPSFEPLEADHAKTLIRDSADILDRVTKFAAELESNTQSLLNEMALLLVQELPSRSTVDEDDLRALSSVLLIGRE